MLIGPYSCSGAVVCYIKFHSIFFHLEVRWPFQYICMFICTLNYLIFKIWWMQQTCIHTSSPSLLIRKSRTQVSLGDKSTMPQLTSIHQIHNAFCCCSVFLQPHLQSLPQMLNAPPVGAGVGDNCPELSHHQGANLKGPKYPGLIGLLLCQTEAGRADDVVLGWACYFGYSTYTCGLIKEDVWWHSAGLLSVKCTIEVEFAVKVRKTEKRIVCQEGLMICNQSYIYMY